MKSNIKHKPGDIVGKGFLLKERIKPIYNGKGYLCRFECPRCHKDFEADLYSITSKSSQHRSCGCYLREEAMFQSNDLSGQRFGKLAVLKKSEKKIPHPNGGNFLFWDCICDCGNETTVSTSHLKSGHTQSYGLCVCSHGEEAIKTVLDKMNIQYQQQKSFEQCRNPNTRALLRFDFYLPDYNCCIEYDGEQHFHIPQNKKSTFFTQQDIDNIQYRDKIKTEYCRQHGLYLIRIPYSEYNKISEQFILEKLQWNY